MSFATLNGDRVVRALVRCPTRGVWVADVTTDRGTVTEGPAVLVLGGLTLAGTILRGATYGGVASVRLAGGAGRWRSVELAARAYRNDLGVPRSVVLADIATEAGEVLTPATTDVRLGPSWVRAAGLAATALTLAWGADWYVSDAGPTILGTRVAAPVVVPYSVTQERPEFGTITLATEAPEGVRPGMVLGTRPIGSVVLDLAESLRVTVWTP